MTPTELWRNFVDEVGRLPYILDPDHGGLMNTLSYIDPKYSNKASISFGQFMLCVNIDGLESVNFSHPSLPTLLSTMPAQSLATLLEMGAAKQWQIDLNADQTISRMAEAFRMRGFFDIAAKLETLKQQKNDDMPLMAYWSEVLRPAIQDQACASGVDMNSDMFKTVVAWAHPVNSSKKLHPRAIRFLEYGLAHLLENRLAGFVKTA
jgi:hypothetical protein